MQIEFRTVDIDDIDKFDESGLDGKACLEGCCKMIATDDAGHIGHMFIPMTTLDTLGVDYISKHVKLEYSDALEEWLVKLSQNDFYNDPKRNAPKIVFVEFVEDKAGENAEVWRNTESGRYYLRILCSEPFARWITCSGRATGWSGCNEIRPNITFCNVNNNEVESVRYDDWNGTAAYSDTFNPDFRKRCSTI